MWSEMQIQRLPVNSPRRLPVNSSHHQLVTRSTCHEANWSHSQVVTPPTRHTVNLSHVMSWCDELTGSRAIFSEGFTETLGTRVCFQWIIHWQWYTGHKILCSVNGFTENADKYCFQWSMHWNVELWILFSVKCSLKQCIRKSNFSEQFVSYIKPNTIF